MNPVQLGNLLTEVGNSMFLVAAAFGFFYSIRWRAAKKLSMGSVKLVHAWELICIAVLVRIGWWSLALQQAGVGQTYHPWFVQYKWAMAIPAAMLFSYGILGFIQAVEGFSKNKKILLFIGSFFLSILISFI